MHTSCLHRASVGSGLGNRHCMHKSLIGRTTKVKFPQDSPADLHTTAEDETTPNAYPKCARRGFPLIGNDRAEFRTAPEADAAEPNIALQHLGGALREHTMCSRSVGSTVVYPCPESPLRSHAVFQSGCTHECSLDLLTS